MLKLAYFLRNVQNLWANNARTIRIKNAKFLWYYFYMSTNVHRDFQIHNSVPLIRDNGMYRT